MSEQMIQESHDEAAANRQIEYDMAGAKFDELYDTYKLDSEYADYIMYHGDRMIGNGDMLIEAQEDGYLFEEFRDHWIGNYLGVEK